MPNTETLAILTVRNEGAFLIDWLAHHRAVGFTRFLVFSNGCQDGTDRMLDRLQAMGWLTHVRNDAPAPEGPQWAALKAAERHPLKEAADWVMVIDIDEFVCVHAGDGTLSALFDALPRATAIPLTWRLFGNAGIAGYEDRPIPEIFTRAAPAALAWPWRASLFKTLFRDDGSYRRLGVHRPRDPDPARLAAQVWVDGSGRTLPDAYREARIFTPPGQDCRRLAQLNHYALGAMESYVVKCDRGRANRAAPPFDLAYWVERNLCAEEDRRLADRFARCAPWRDELRADAELRALHDAAVRWRRGRFLRLMEDEAYRSLFGRLLMAPASRILTPEESRFLMTFAAREQSRKAAGIDPPPETG